jgi:hypothetical protein
MARTLTVIDRLEASALRVARALVRRDSVKLVVTGTRACWDSATDTLYLPSYRVDEAPESPEAILRYNAWRGLLDHECSHARNTTGVEKHQAEWRARGWDVSRLHTLWHVFEDPWIEEKWSQEYPGARRHIQAARTLTIRETGGAAPCWPDYTGKTGTPIGVFGAFVQALLRLNTGIVTKEEISPDILTLIDGCQDILDRFDPASPLTSSATNASLTADLWERLLSFMPPAEPPPEAPRGDSSTSESPEAGSDSDADTDSDDAPSPEGDGDDDDDGDDGDADEDDGGSAPGDGDGDDAGDGASDDNAGESSPTNPGAGTTRTQSGTGGPVRADTGLTARDLVAGEWGEIASLSDIVAAGHVDASNPDTLPYTVHPSVKDEWTRPTEPNRVALDRIRKSTSAEASYLAARLRRVIAAKRADLRVGCQEDGDDLDLDSAAMLATRLDSVRVWERTVTRRADETFVTVLIDCSGSMGDSAPQVRCPVHGVVEQRGDVCSRTSRAGKRCGEPLTRTAVTKSAHAAMTSVLLHDALRISRVPHCVLGYTTFWDYRAGYIDNTEDPLTNRPMWSRVTPIRTYEFVRSPGSEPGDLLPRITGYNANADGSSLRAAAKYMAENRGSCSRMIMLVVSDGLPACDDTLMEVADLKRTVGTLADAGVEVYGIGVGLRDSDRKKFAELYPDNTGGTHRAPTGHVFLPPEGMDRGVLDRIVSLFATGNGRGKVVA